MDTPRRLAAGVGSVELIAGTSNRMTDQVLQSALEYASYGWRVVPLHSVLPDGSCTCGHVRFDGTPNACAKTVRNRGKHPRIAKWQDNASADEDTVSGWLDKWPTSNIGVTLGETSGIIDLETDSDEGEKFLFKLFDGEPPVTPMFKSGRGKHRLFKWRPDLPGGASIPLAIGDLHIGDLKLGNDSKGSQSVFPPSNHWSGGKYEWLLHPSQTDGIADITDVVRSRLFNWNGLDSLDDGKSRKTKTEWEDITAPRREGEGRNNSAASYVGGMLRRLASLDDEEGVALVFQASSALNAGNMPPLDDEEFRNIFKSILRKEQQRRLEEAADLAMPKNPQQIPDSMGKPSLRVPTGMRLVIVRDDPPIYELYHPRFKNERGCVRLTAAQLMNFGALQTQALEQADYPLPDSFGKPWRAQNGIREQLIFAAEERQVNAATKRLATAAEYLLNKLNNSRPDSDGRDEPDPRRPVRMSSGEVWFKWQEIWKDGLLGGTVEKDQPRRLAHTLNLSRIAQKLWPHRGSNRQRYTVFGKELMAKLEAIAEADFDDSAHTIKEGQTL